MSEHILPEKHSINIPTLTEAREKFLRYKNQSDIAAEEFGLSRTCQRFKHKDSEQYTIMQKDGWELRYFNIRPGNTSDYVLFRIKDVEDTPFYDSVPVIEFNCDNYTLKFNRYCVLHKDKVIPKVVQDIVEEFCSNPCYHTSNIQIVPTSYLKLYIAILEDVDDFMAPTLVAHSILGAHLYYYNTQITELTNEWNSAYYLEWLKTSFRKCVVKVNQKEFKKISSLHTDMYLGHENTTLGGIKSCAIPLPVWSNEIPNVLKFSKLWKPKIQ